MARLTAKLGTNAEPAVPWLVEASGHTNANIQSTAVWVLGELHLQPELCVPRLISLLQSTNDNLRGNCFYALSLFGPAAKTALPEVTRGCHDPQSWIRNNATNALRAITSTNPHPRRPFL